MNLLTEVNDITSFRKESFKKALIKQIVQMNIWILLVRFHLDENGRFPWKVSLECRNQFSSNSVIRPLRNRSQCFSLWKFLRKSLASIILHLLDLPSFYDVPRLPGPDFTEEFFDWLAQSCPEGRTQAHCSGLSISLTVLFFDWEECPRMIGFFIYVNFAIKDFRSLRLGCMPDAAGCRRLE